MIKLHMLLPLLGKTPTYLSANDFDGCMFGCASDFLSSLSSKILNYYVQGIAYEESNCKGGGIKLILTKGDHD